MLRALSGKLKQPDQLLGRDDGRLGWGRPTRAWTQLARANRDRQRALRMPRTSCAPYAKPRWCDLRRWRAPCSKRGGRLTSEFPPKGLVIKRWFEYTFGRSGRDPGLLNQGDFMRRLIISAAALAALATPASLFVVGSTTPAGATTPASLVCKRSAGNSGGKVTVSGCNVPTADKLTYASASAPKGLALATGGTLTWASSKKTTKFVITQMPRQARSARRSRSSGEVVATGHVTGGTAAVTKVNQLVSVSVCLKTAAPNAIKIAPGTTAKL